MNPAEVGIRAGRPEDVREGEPAVMRIRIKDPVRIIWRSRSHAVVVANPGPFHGIAHLNARWVTRIEVISPAADGHIEGRCRSEEWKEDEGNSE